MIASCLPLSLEVASFEVIVCLGTGSMALCSTSLVMVALDALGVSSMTPMLVRSMMTPHTMVLSKTLINASVWT